MEIESEAMALNWNSVSAKDVERACNMVLSGELSPRSQAKGIFLIKGNDKLPAKHVLRLAYCIANGLPLDSKIKFTSGESLVKRLRSLGFDVEHTQPDKDEVIENESG